MTLTDLLKACTSKGITLTVVNGELRYRAPIGTITDELKMQLKKHKDMLIKMLSGERNYLLILSRTLNREVIISWNGENPKVVYLDSTPYSVREIQRLRESQLSPRQLKTIHEVKEQFDGNLAE